MVTNKNFDDFDPKLDELLRLPRFSPSSGFSDRVMSQVALFQQRAPVRSAIAADLRRPGTVAAPTFAGLALPPFAGWLIPRSRPARYAAGALAAVTSVATTTAAVVLVTQLSLVTFIGGIAFDRMKVALTLWGAELVNGAVGQTAVGYLNGGAPGQSALVMGGLAVGVITAFAGLRKAASLNPSTI